MSKLVKLRFNASKAIALLAIAAAVPLMFQGLAFADGSSASDPNPRTVTSAIAELRAFDKSGSIEELKSAIDTLTWATNVTGLPREKLTSDRLVITKAWIAVLRRIEAMYDPAFDPNDPKDRPLMCVEPPMDSDGTQLRGCASPNDVKDAKARAEYLLAIERNKAKAHRMQRWIEVNDLDESAMTTFELTLKVFREVVGADSRLKEIVQAGGLSYARTKTIEEWLSSSGR